MKGNQFSFIDWITPSAIAITGALLNAVEMGSLFYNKRTKLPFDLTLISFAFSDFLLAASTLASGMILFYVPSVQQSNWFPIFSGLILLSSTLSSALHVLFIAIQRVIAVMYPLQFSVWITRGRCIVAIILLWLASAILIIPLLFRVELYEQILAFSPLITGVTVIICYGIINHRMIAKRRMFVSGPSSQSVHILLNSISVSAVFLISTLPYTIHGLYHKTKIGMPHYMYYLFLLQVVFDPVVYFLFNYWKGKRCVLCYGLRRNRNVSTVTTQQ